MNHKNSLKNLACPNENCPHFRKHRQGNIIRHSFYKTRQGRRRRYRCKDCGRTFSSTFGTAYYRLQSSRICFDDVATMSVNGIGKSAISRIKRLSWNTVDRWLHQAFLHAQNFNSTGLQGYEIVELQADEICTFVDSKKRVTWLFTALEVSSRLWVGLAVGRRSYQNVERCLLDVLQRGRAYGRFLFTTDGLHLYRWAVERLMAGICIYGQIVKTRRKERIVSVRRRIVCGTPSELDHALLHSEDSSKLNTSFVERHNLTIRQGSSYLCRRTACHAREDRTLEEHLELLQLHYNFIRPHSALRFGAEVRTPAMQAGLAVRKLNFREVFMMRVFFFLCALPVLLGWIRDFILRGVDLGSNSLLVFRPNNT